MRIAITGGTGFVGTALTNRLIKEKHEVYILTRNPDRHSNTSNIKYVGWLKEGTKPEKALPHLDAIVNLAGESINSGRWTEERKERILKSRLNATDSVMDLIQSMDVKPKALINASAIGFYGTSETTTFTEKHETPGNDFLANVVSKWEQRAKQAEELGVRTVLLRFGIILGDEGALPKMALPYKLFIGGNVGSGEQWLSWIHIDDIVGLIKFSIENESVNGPVNATAPNPLKNKDFGKTIGKVIGRPHWIPVPSFVLKLLFGEMSIILLEGQKVLPNKAKSLGYNYKYTDLKPALKSIFD